MEIKQQIEKLLDNLNEGVYEKKEVIALTLLSAVAGESIFLLGAPGVAKSLIARRLKFAFVEGSKQGGHFEYLMNRFSTPDEIFGPVSISQLKNNDKYERIVKNYLPTATVVFLDEIWKAGPSIQNALLTVLNEKIYRNGDKEIKLPLKALISASNELPMKGEGLEALWDRFILRYEVKSIEQTENFNQMILSSSKLEEVKVDDQLKITNQEFEVWTEQINKITVPETILNLIDVIRKSIEENHNKKQEKKESKILISDRRWKKIIKLLRTSAFLNDRKDVDLMDCFLIIHCIWHNTEQVETVSLLVKDAIQKHGYKLSIETKDVKEKISDLKADIKEQTSKVKDTRKKNLEIHKESYYRIQKLSAEYPLIQIADYEGLTNSNNRVNLYQEKNGYNTYNNYEKKQIRKGNDKYHVLVDDKEYELKTVIDGEKTLTTYKPHPPSIDFWNKQIETIFSFTKKMKDELANYEQTELKHVRKNIFVNPDLAEIVVSHLTQTFKTIEKIELDVKKIQNDFMKLKDETIVLEEEFKD